LHFVRDRGRLLRAAVLQPGNPPPTLLRGSRRRRLAFDFLETRRLLTSAAQFAAGFTTLDAPQSIATDGSGNTYLAGAYDTSATIAPLSAFTGGNAYVAKLDSSGKGVWVKNLGNLFNLQVSVDSNKNVYAIGNTQGGQGTILNPDNSGNPQVLNNQGDVCVEVMKFDPSGNFLWAKIFTSSSNPSASFVQNGSLVADAQGDVYVTCQTFNQIWESNPPNFGNITQVFNPTSPSPTGEFAFAAKLSPAGATLWATGVPDAADTAAVALDPAGNAYLTGVLDQAATIGTTSFNPAANSIDVYLVKLSSGDGSITWAGRVAEGANVGGHSVAVDGSGNAYVAGAFQGSASFGSPAAPTNLTAPAGKSDLYVAAYSPSGSLSWAKGFAGAVVNSSATPPVSPPVVASNGHDEIFLAGTFQNTIRLGSSTLNSVGSTDLFVAQMDASGNVLQAQNSLGTSNDSYTGSNLSLNANGLLSLAGSYTGAAAPTFDGVGLPLPTAGSIAMLVAGLQIPIPQPTPSPSSPPTTPSPTGMGMTPNPTPSPAATPTVSSQSAVFLKKKGKVIALQITFNGPLSPGTAQTLANYQLALMMKGRTRKSPVRFLPIGLASPGYSAGSTIVTLVPPRNLKSGSYRLQITSSSSGGVLDPNGQPLVGGTATLFLRA
jgi:hypothetical protein